MPVNDSESNVKPSTIADITDMTLWDAAELFERSRAEYFDVSIQVNGDRFLLTGRRRPAIRRMPSCKTCVAMRTEPEGRMCGDEYHFEFLCARRGYIIETMGPCNDYASELSLDPSIVQGGNPIIVGPATAVDALRRGRAVAIDDVWYRMVEGRLCTLSPHGDRPARARENWTPARLAEGHVCIIIDHGDADDRADRECSE